MPGFESPNVASNESDKALPPTAGAPAKSVASAPATTARVSSRRCRARALFKYAAYVTPSDLNHG